MISLSVISGVFYLSFYLFLSPLSLCNKVCSISLSLSSLFRCVLSLSLFCSGVFYLSLSFAGPSDRGRDRHYVDGSALLRDRQPGASKHALAKIARSALDMHVGSVL